MLARHAFTFGFYAQLARQATRFSAMKSAATLLLMVLSLMYAASILAFALLGPAEVKPVQRTPTEMIAMMDGGLLPLDDLLLPALGDPVEAPKVPMAADADHPPAAFFLRPDTNALRLILLLGAGSVLLYAGRAHLYGVLPLRPGGSRGLGADLRGLGPLLAALSVGAAWPWIGQAGWHITAVALAALSATAAIAAAGRPHPIRGPATRMCGFLGTFAGWTTLIMGAGVGSILIAPIGMPVMVGGGLAIALVTLTTLLAQPRGRMLPAMTITVTLGLIATAGALMSSSIALASFAVAGIAALTLSLVFSST